MGAMAGALPQGGQPRMTASGHYGIADRPSFSPNYHGHHMPQSGPRGLPVDSNHSGNAQQQSFMAPQFSSLPQQMAMMGRQPLQPQQQGQYAPYDPYGFGMNPMQMANYDPRMAPTNPYGAVPQMSKEPGQYGRRASEPAPIPSYPRGPPRKPKQSGHALWVGNLPPNANVTDLKDHFSRDATEDIQSLFLISKSNCAFVNYRSEAACTAAMNRFHDSRFHGVRLVCRLRRGSSAPGIGIMLVSESPDLAETPPPTDSPATPATPVPADERSSPTIVGSSTEFKDENAQPGASSSTGPSTDRTSEKFFIVKSLTVQDLEASVRNGIWATQSHNEKTLNEAYENADNVYLIFSANKSGEYFGYARMASLIAGEPVNLTSTFEQPDVSATGNPQSIPTAATETAPKGRIIDDSARGTIFWEADRSDDEEEASTPAGDGERGGNSNWGRQFTIEWISTSRLPFYRTRGLRNPWK